MVIATGMNNSIKQNRIESIDLLRGLVLGVFALHVFLLLPFLVAALNVDKAVMS